MATDFFRSPTIDEKRDFQDIGPTRVKTPKQKFLAELGNARTNAAKKKLPFFKKAAMNDFDEYYRERAKQSLRIHGYVEPTDFKSIQIDWKKYSSPGNIVFVEVQDVRDANLSKRRPFDVIFKSFRYKYKGYGEEGDSNMSVMEDEVFAVKRARAIYDNKPENIEISLAEKQSYKYGNPEPMTKEEIKAAKSNSNATEDQEEEHK